MVAGAAPSVALDLPAVLRPVAGCDRLKVTGRRVGEAFESAFAQVPVLRHHLMLDSGELRPHVLCILNGTCLPRDEVNATALADGDHLQLHQAISGG